MRLRPCAWDHRPLHTFALAGAAGYEGWRKAIGAGVSQ